MSCGSGDSSITTARLRGMAKLAYNWSLDFHGGFNTTVKIAKATLVNQKVLYYDVCFGILARSALEKILVRSQTELCLFSTRVGLA